MLVNAHAGKTASKPTYTVVNLQPGQVRMARNMNQWAETAGEEAYEVTSLMGPTICKCFGLHPWGGADVQYNSWKLADFVPRLALWPRVPTVDGSKVDLGEASVILNLLKDPALLQYLSLGLPLLHFSIYCTSLWIRFPFHCLTNYYRKCKKKKNHSIQQWYLVHEIQQPWEKFEHLFFLTVGKFILLYMILLWLYYIINLNSW